MIAPTIHLNGSSAKSLREGYCEVFRAINNALDKLAQAAPHGRDYYVQKDPDAFEKARKEHRARVDALVKVREEMQGLAIMVSDQEIRR